MPGWLRTALLVAALAVGAALLWFGLVLLVVALAIVALPFWLWSLFARRRSPVGPVTLDGSATRVEPDSSDQGASLMDGSRAPDSPRDPRAS